MFHMFPMEFEWLLQVEEHDDVEQPVAKRAKIRQSEEDESDSSDSDGSDSSDSDGTDSSDSDGKESGDSDGSDSSDSETDDEGLSLLKLFFGAVCRNCSHLQ
jgi:hypothetical protein